MFCNGTLAQHTFFPIMYFQMEILLHNFANFKVPTVINTYSSMAHFNMDFDVVIDCSGSTSGFVSACKLVKPKGTIVLKSTTSR